MAARRACLAWLLVAVVPAHAFELPWWLDSIDITAPGPSGIGAVSLSGTWIDTGAPDAIRHSVRGGALHLSLSAPGLNVPTGDALTPWSLTEEFGPLDPYAGLGGVNEVFGSVFSVDPRDRGVRELVSGPDFLGWIEPPPRGTFEGLGTGDRYVSAAYDVSANGRVVAGANQLASNDTGVFDPTPTSGFVTSEAFVWTPETGRTPIGLLPGGVPGGSTATAVSADGNYLAGVSTSGREPSVDREAFRWSLGAGMEPLGTVQGVSSKTEARAVSRGGRVVVGVDKFFPPIGGGYGRVYPFPPFNGKRAFRYTDRGGMQDLGVLPGHQASEAVGVSAGGEVVVGNSERLAITSIFPGPRDMVQPFRWTQTEGLVGLGNLPRPKSLYGTGDFVGAYFPPQRTEAAAVSADGRVVVGRDSVQITVSDPDETYFTDPSRPLPTAAFRWSEAEGWTDLGRLRAASAAVQIAAEATDASGDGGLIIGSATFQGPCSGFCNPIAEVPFLWDEARGMRPLERVLAGDYGLDFDGWDLGEATAISDDGTTIVGTGVNPDGVQEAWRAVLRRNTRPGDADFDGDVDQWDHAAVASNLGRRAIDGDLYYEDGDFDADGVVDDADMLLLMANYDGRWLGDFNADGVVDAADYTVWRDHEGQQTGVADSTVDGVVNENDLAAWHANFGATLGDLSAAPVPEPSAGLTLLLATLGCGVRRRRLACR